MSSAQLCMYSNELSTTMHVLTHELSTNVHVLKQGSFGTQQNCACTHTRLIGNSAQLRIYLQKIHPEPSTMVPYILMTAIQILFLCNSGLVLLY